MREHHGTFGRRCEGRSFCRYPQGRVEHDRRRPVLLRTDCSVANRSPCSQSSVATSRNSQVNLQGSKDVEEMTVYGTWPVIQQPSSLMQGAPGQTGRWASAHQQDQPIGNAIGNSRGDGTCGLPVVCPRTQRPLDPSPDLAPVVHDQESSKARRVGPRQLARTVWAIAPFAVHLPDDWPALRNFDSPFAEQSRDQFPALREPSSTYRPTECRCPGTAHLH